MNLLAEVSGTITWSQGSSRQVNAATRSLQLSQGVWNFLVVLSDVRDWSSRDLQRGRLVLGIHMVAGYYSTPLVRLPRKMCGKISL